MTDKFKISVLISSYNYRRYIEETIESVLSQSRAADEIIVVDDGSIDGSVDFIKDKYGNNKNITIINKENGGQMSALNEAFRRSSGDILSFLDSDDLYEQNYLEEIEKIYTKNKNVHYVTCAYREIGNRSGVISRYKNDADLGITPVGVYYGNIWTSGPTATISIRRVMLVKYFPVPFEREWVISPDACLSMGASMVGSRKYFLAKPLIKYRIHESNAHVVTKLCRYETLIIKYQFMNYASKINNINIDRLIYYVSDEFATIDKTIRKYLFFKYLKLLYRSKENIFWKILESIKILFMSYRS